MPLIGCGGVEDAETALAKIEAGANLVQLYTGLALKGPGIVEEILDGLSRAVEARGSEPDRRTGRRPGERLGRAGRGARRRGRLRHGSPAFAERRDVPGLAPGVSRRRRPNKRQ